MKNIILLFAFLLPCTYLFAQQNHNNNSNWLSFDTKQQPTTAERLAVGQKTLFGLGLNDDLTQLSVSDDDLGYHHYRYQQNYQSYPVEGAQLLIHENQYGLAYAANGGLVRGIAQNATVALSEQTALDKALQHTKATRFAWQDASYQKALQQTTDNPNATFYPKGQLVWASNSPQQEPQSYKLCYKFDVFATQPLQRKFIFVDAQTGNIVTEQNQLHDADAPCTGTAMYSCSNPVGITADSYNGTYRLRETSNRKIETYTANNGTAYAFFDITSTDNNFNEDPAATAAHWATEKTYDYYKNTHNRLSFNNANGKLMSWVHFDDGFDNAFWNGSWMTYGDGSVFSPLVSTDVVGHEITHGVTQYSANLSYSYEPGALNESFSDIFGTVIEFYADPTCADWKIGEDITANYNGGQGIRNMQNPNLRGQPDTYEGTYWYYGNNDNGGVHYNSGVQNYWFYLLSQGGNGTNDNGTAYNVTGITLSKAARIAYRMLTVYLTPTSQYSDARSAAISAATDLYGAGSNELTQVANAWCAVGVGSCSLASGSITLTSPNGGETWQAGSTHNITWTSTGSTTNIDIHYSIDGSSTWNFIANQANTGSYTWTVPNAPTALAQVSLKDNNNPTITDKSNANFTIQGCNVLASFSSSATTVCVPTTVTFTNSSTGATTYQWAINGSTQSTATNFSYNFAAPGVYTLLLTATNGTCSDTYTQTITVNPTATAAFTHNENTLTLSTFATQLSANSYTWDFGDGTTATTQNATHTYAAAGTYNVCLTVVNSCGSNNTCQNVTLSANCQDTWTQYTNGDYVVAIAAEGNYMWIGTRGGLVRLDKTTGDKVFYNNANSGLPNNDVGAIAIDATGNKWIGTNGGGLAKFDGTTWTTYNTSNSGLPNNAVSAIAIDATGNKWIGAYGGGLAKFDSTTWTTYTTSNSGLPNNQVLAIAIDATGNKWIGAYGGGLAKFSGTIWTTYNTANSGLPNNDVGAIAIDAAGNKWIGTNVGAAKFSGTIWTTYTTFNSGLPSNYVQAIAIDAAGNKWIGTYGGVAKFDGTIWTTYTTSNSGLPNNSVYTIAIDAAGSKWIGTWGGGVAKFDGTIWTTYTISNSGLPNDQILDIVIDAGSNKWIAVHGVLAKFDGTNWTIYDSSNSGLSGSQVNSITIDAGSNKWIGTFGGGLVKFDGTTFLWTTYNTSNSGLPHDQILDVVIDAVGNKWIGTWGGGLAKFDGTTWTIYDNSNSALPNNNVYAIAIDAVGNKWIGTWGGGLAKFDGTNWTNYNTSNNSGLPSDYITAITIDAAGNKWIGTYGGGVAKFDGTNWTNYNTSNNSVLPSYNVSAITIDAVGNKWMGTNGDGVGVLSNCSVLCSATASFSAPATPVCSNTPITFTNNSTGAATYQWSINGSNVSTATNLSHTFATAGTYSIALVATNGTCSNTYTQTITVNDNATQLQLGNDIVQCGSSSVVLDCGISGALFYNWDLNGTLVGSTQTITATQTGMYHLSIMDACNQVGIDSVYVLLDNDCVYPGDVNYDNIVNYLDLLPIGLNYGATGNTRSNASFAWLAQPCSDWSGTQANNQNLKHADCNGNGFIDNNDPAAIQQNYGQTHGTAPTNPVNSSSPIALSAALGTPPPSFGNNTTVYIDLYINNNQNLDVTAYGLGFKVNYQFPNCIKVNNAYIDFTGSWLGTAGVDMATVQKNFLSNNLKSGTVEVALTLLNHQNQSGYGKVGTLVADVDIYASIGGLQATASMSGQQMTVANGNFIPVGGVVGSFTLANPAAPSVSLVASPTTNLVSSSCPNTLSSTVSNCSGCTYVWKRNGTTIAAATSANYSATQIGTYTLIVTNAGGYSATSTVSLVYNNAIVNSSGTALPFCTPAGINSSAECIKSVQFGTGAANVSSSDNGYGNYVCSKTFNIPVSCPSTLTLQPKFVGATQTEYWTVWVDKNGDGDFVDEGERIWQKTTTNANAFSKTFAATNIPSGLLGKSFRMRVAMKRNAYSTSPCENFAQGEVEDYTLRFVASSCKTDVIEETSDAFSNLHLFPNPVTDALHIGFTTDTEEQITIRVYDVIGRLVFEEPVWSVVGENTTQIAVASLPKGIYIMQLSMQNEQLTKRFVKQ